MGSLGDLPRSATAHMMEGGTAFALSKDKLHGLLLSDPEPGVRRLRQPNFALTAQGAALQKPQK